MRDPGNIADISRLLPDYMGFIYYPASKRFAGKLSPDLITGMPSGIRKVGVFVDASMEEVLSISQAMDFRVLQLHGSESPDYCREMKDRGYEIIKAFGIAGRDDFNRMKDYLDASDLFLFDTASGDFGGSGKKFEWKLLEKFKLEKPFMLSGGIAAGDIEDILQLKHPQFYGVDLNSRFEAEPGIKKRLELEGFINKIRA